MSTESKSLIIGYLLELCWLNLDLRSVFSPAALRPSNDCRRSEVHVEWMGPTESSHLEPAPNITNLYLYSLPKLSAEKSLIYSVKIKVSLLHTTAVILLQLIDLFKINIHFSGQPF